MTETNVEQLAKRVEKLSETVEQQADRLEEQAETIEQQAEEIEELQQYKQETEPVVEALRKGLKSALSQITELQNRELEKGAHLREEHIAEEDIDVASGEIERFLKDGEYYYRTVGAEDPLGNGSSATVEYSDLLPIQQLAKGDPENLEREDLPVQYAARLWAERDLWKSGSGEVSRYIDASDAARWIRTKEDRDIKREYAQKLARRAFEMIETLARDRLFRRQVSHRKDGLNYQETRLILPTHSEIPGEQTAPRDTNAPRTSGVPG